MHRRYSLVLAAIAALCAAFVVAPAQADTKDTASWDFATGLRLTPGTVTQVASLTVDEAVGLCTVEMTATNGQSENPGNNLIVEENGVAVLTLFGVEDEPFTTSTGSVRHRCLGGRRLRRLPRVHRVTADVRRRDLGGELHHADHHDHRAAGDDDDGSR